MQCTVEIHRHCLTRVRHRRPARSGACCHFPACAVLRSNMACQQSLHCSDLLTDTFSDQIVNPRACNHV